MTTNPIAGVAELQTLGQQLYNTIAALCLAAGDTPIVTVCSTTGTKLTITAKCASSGQAITFNAYYPLTPQS